MAYPKLDPSDVTVSRLFKLPQRLLTAIEEAMWQRRERSLSGLLRRLLGEWLASEMGTTERLRRLEAELQASRAEVASLKKQVKTARGRGTISSADNAAILKRLHPDHEPVQNDMRSATEPSRRIRLWA